MLYHLLITPLLVGLLLACWIGFQAFVRRRSPGLGHDADVLQGRFSCGTCIGFEDCHVALTRPRRDSGAAAEILEIDRSDEVTL
jgi:hypothetical protein